MTARFDAAAVRADFPQLARNVEGRRVIYFDNAATALKPETVIDAVTSHLAVGAANVHRAGHRLSQEASLAYENARQKVAGFFGCLVEEVVFTRGATDGVNLVAEGLELAADENVVTSILEHHSNFLPWAARSGLRTVGVLANGLPDVEQAARMIDSRTRLLTITACSNVTGVLVPLGPWVALARRHGIPLLVDAAQAAAHRKIDFGELGCDFLVVSGHKLCGPPGAGVLCGRTSALERLSVRRLGGGSVKRVRMDGSHVLRDLPWRLEAGTPDIAAVLGLGAAIDYLERLGMDAVQARSDQLRELMHAQLAELPGIRCYWPPREQPAICLVSLVEVTARLSPDYLCRVLSDSYAIMTRAGHMCAHPLHESWGEAGTLRASLMFYNTEEEILSFRAALDALLRLL